MVRNRSCPAVSQICNLTVFLSILTVRKRKSTPIVLIYDSVKASSYVRYQGQKFVDRYDPYCYYHQLNALDTHNIGRGRGGIAEGLEVIKAKTLSIGFSTDLLIPVIEQKLLAEHILNAQYAEIETDFGHDAFLIETDAIKELILTFRSKNKNNDFIM